MHQINSDIVVVLQMAYGLDVSPRDDTVLAGDNLGRIHLIDPRQEKPFAAPMVHKKDKVCLSKRR